MSDPLAAVMAAPMPALAQRRDLLLRWAERLDARREDMARRITAATRKPIRLARNEVERGLTTLRGTAASASLLEPREHDLGSGARATVSRVALGPVLAVTPFNFPLNLALHKLAPAILAGCPVLWKPSPKAPGVAELALELLGHHPSLALSHASDDAVASLCTDPRLALFSFTGSVAVGRRLQQLAWRARCILELGGNAALVWHQLDDVTAAADRAALGACAQGGQVCIGIQRILIPHDRDDWRDALVAAFRRLPSGDPSDERTINGPLIDGAAVARVKRDLAALIAAGGKVLCGGEWTGDVLAPTLLENVPHDHPLVHDTELFAPIATLHRFQNIDEALAVVDDTPFGLQAGIYTRDESVIGKAQRLRLGSLVLNDIPTRRDDRLPYGGTKDSGCGREGTMEAVLDYTEPRVLLRA